MRRYIVAWLRKFLGIEQDKQFLLEYGDASAGRIDRVEIAIDRGV